MIIGFTGKKSAGKTTAAAHLVEHHGFKRHPFAAPIKRMLSTFGLSDADLDGRHKERPHPLLMNKTPRHAMQTLGTEWGRNCIGDEFWTQAWRLSAPEGHIVADDVRFPDEAALIRSLGGHVVNVVRHGCCPDDPHESESHDLSEPDDLTILNVARIEDLKYAVEFVLTNLQPRP